jgi:hypothetical protein
MQMHGISEIVGKLSAIEQRISMIENDDDDDDDDDPENELGALGTLFASPEIKSMLMQGLMTMFTKKPQTMAVAGIPENDDEKLKVALEILKKNVPDLADKLLKLADMSVNESIKFQMLIKML